MNDELSGFRAQEAGHLSEARRFAWLMDFSYVRGRQGMVASSTR